MEETLEFSQFKYWIKSRASTDELKRLEQLIISELNARSLIILKPSWLKKWLLK